VRWLVLRLAASIGAACLVLALPARAAEAPGLAPELRRKLEVLDRFVGTWDVEVHVRRPQRVEARYVETYRWTLGGHFLQAETREHTLGETLVVLATYDPAADGYPFWIFSSTGEYYALPAGRWDAASRTMRWRNPIAIPVSLESECRFPDASTRECRTLVKDWKGSVLTDQEVRARRRGP
jgi:hypothetical protein